MDNKIGEFIKILRVEKKLSQGDLAELLNVTRQTVSKWETGVSLPSLDNIKEMSKIFEVEIEELINGELKLVDDIEKNSTKKSNMFFWILFLFILVFWFFLLIYFINNYNSVSLYKIRGANDNFILNDSLLFISKEKIVFKIGNIEVNEEVVDSSKDFKIEFFVKKGNKTSSVETYYFESDGLIEEFYGYNEIFSSTFLESLQFMMLRVEYFDVEGKIQSEKMELDVSKVFKNSKLLYISPKSSNQDNKSSVDIESRNKELKKKLQDEGFLFCSVDNICGVDDKYKLFYEYTDGVTYVELGRVIKLFSFYEDGNYFFSDNQINIDSTFFSGKYILKKGEFDGKFVDKISKTQKQLLKEHVFSLKKIAKILGLYDVA